MNKRRFAAKSSAAGGASGGAIPLDEKGLFRPVGFAPAHAMPHGGVTGRHRLTVHADLLPQTAVKESVAHPDQLAIGIDNETALIVRGRLADVVGAGTVHMYDGSGRSAPRVVTLRSGDRYISPVGANSRPFDGFGVDPRRRPRITSDRCTQIGEQPEMEELG